MTPISPAYSREDLIAMIRNRDALISDLKATTAANALVDSLHELLEPYEGMEPADLFAKLPGEEAQRVVRARAALTSVGAPAMTAKADTNLREALEPFADFADPRNKIPPDTILTAGSAMARKQITMADCYAARAALASEPVAGTVEREAIARIIDPGAYADRDNRVSDRHLTIALALKKADAILALGATVSPQGGGAGDDGAEFWCRLMGEAIDALDDLSADYDNFTDAESRQDFASRRADEIRAKYKDRKITPTTPAPGAADRAAVIEECAKFVEQHQEAISETAKGSERYLAPRKVGNLMGIAYVDGLRGLASKGAGQ